MSIKKFCAGLSVLSFATVLSGAGGGMALANPVISISPETELATAPNTLGEPLLWEKYKEGSILESSDMDKLISYVSSDLFLDNIQNLNREEMAQWRYIMEISRNK